MDRIRDAVIDENFDFEPTPSDWIMESVAYATRWSWVRRCDEEWIGPDGESRPFRVAEPLLGWALIRHRETGDAVYVGITADPDGGSPYPAPQAEGFTGYVHESVAKPGQYIPDGGAGGGEDLV